jgi:hypothetical protein
MLGPERIEAITYHHGPYHGDMDRDLAAAIAGAAHVRHRVVEGYRGDFMGLLRYNASRGQGVAHFCDEGSAWTEMDEEFRSTPNAALIVGDRQPHHAWLGRKAAGADALMACSVKPPDAIGWFLDSLSPDSASSLRESWDRRFDELAAELDAVDSWQDRLHRAYLQTRLPYTLNLWRELFCGHSIETISPYLDLDLLQFVLTLPLELNDGDGGPLHSRAIWDAFPDLAAIGLSKGGWNAPDWGREIQLHANQIRESVIDERSPLDDLIPPSAVLKLLAAVESSRPELATATSGYKWRIRAWVKNTPAVQSAYRKVRKNTRMWGGVRPVGQVHLLRRLLCLRLGLTELLASKVEVQSEWTDI